MLIAAFGVEVGAGIGGTPGPRRTCWVSGSMSRTAWELAPDSNQTSRMSISLRNSVWPRRMWCPAGSIASGVWMYQASADSRMNKATMLC